MFGCTAFVHIPNNKRGKLDSKTRKYILLGYGSMQKGYRVFDHLTQKVSYSRNVRFDEQRIGRSPVEEEKSAQLSLILDSIDEPESDHEEEGNTSDDAPAAEVMPRRSTRESRPVDYYGFPQAHLTIYCEPTTFIEATNCPEKAK